MNVEPGQKAPDFTLPTDGDGKVTLSQLAGKKVVLYFYPKDDTSGCTAEACGFRNSFPDYGGTDAVVIGISKEYRRLARQVQEKARSAVHPGLRHRGRGLRKIRHLGREEHVWPQIHGDRPQHLSDRRVGHGSGRVAQGAGAGPRGGSAEGGAGALTAASLTNGAVAILATPDPAAKAALTFELAAISAQEGMPVGTAMPPARPARPAVPELLPPRDMPKRRNFGSPAGRIALLHALAHIASTRSTSLGISSPDLPGSGCRANFSTTGSGSPPRKLGISCCSRHALPVSVPVTATCRRMTGCGRRRRRPQAMCSPGSRSCLWCSRRAVST